MKITLEDGSEIVRPFCPAFCVGHRITKIELEPRDCLLMAVLAISSPKTFVAAMYSLRSCWPYTPENFYAHFGQIDNAE